MDTKTIKLDLEAYQLLRQHQKGRQSFSDVVKEHLGSGPTVAGFREALENVALEEKTLDDVELEIERRQREPGRPMGFPAR